MTSTAMLLADDVPDINTIVAAAPVKARTALASTLTNLALARTTVIASDKAAACLTAVRPLIRVRYPDWHARIDDIDRVSDAAATRTDLASFVAHLTLDPSSASADYAKAPRKDEGYLTLSTVHSAKGLEWTAVHVIHAVDGMFPSDMALADEDGLEEEQRLIYVAVTRARDSLSIYTPDRMPTDWNSYHARHVPAKASRFLTDDAVTCLDLHEPRQPWQTRSAPPSTDAAQSPGEVTPIIRGWSSVGRARSASQTRARDRFDLNPQGMPPERYAPGGHEAGGASRGDPDDRSPAGRPARTSADHGHRSRPRSRIQTLRLPPSHLVRSGWIGGQHRWRSHHRGRGKPR